MPINLHILAQSCLRNRRTRSCPAHGKGWPRKRRSFWRRGRGGTHLNIWRWPSGCMYVLNAPFSLLSLSPFSENADAGALPRHCIFNSLTYLAIQAVIVRKARICVEHFFDFPCMTQPEHPFSISRWPTLRQWQLYQVGVMAVSAVLC